VCSAVSRRVTVVLVDAAGVLVGALPPVSVTIPWWPEVAEVNRAVRDRHGLDIQVLRVLSGSQDPPGGSVTYLAQTADSTDGLTGLTSCAAESVAVGLGAAGLGAAGLGAVDLADHPRRAAFARPGGPAATLRWAEEAVAASGRGPVLEVEQTRTWNLSAIWRLATAKGPLWIKEVPDFFGHEPAVLRWLGASGHGARFPVLVASDSRRMLLEDIPGQDLFGAGLAVCQSIALGLHPVQALAASHVDDLLCAGLPDRRFPALRPMLEAVAEDARRTDSILDELVATLDDRLAAVAACGLPATLVHGDLHPGNVRAEPGGGNVIIDWGDAFVGHPGFDILRLTEALAENEAAAVIARWADRWRADIPDSDPARAVRLLKPVAALRDAAVYAGFLANIEPSEYPYHAGDPPRCLAKAAEFAAADSSRR
jgi:hypothetical protein